MKKISFHIGYPKTGTTSIQKILSQAQINGFYDQAYLGMNTDLVPRLDIRLEHLFRHIAHGSLDPLLFQEMAQIINRLTPRNSGIVSFEGIIRPKNFKILHRQMKMLQDAGPFDLCVFVTTRDPVDWVRSRTRHDRDLMGHSFLYSGIGTEVATSRSITTFSGSLMAKLLKSAQSFKRRNPNYLSSQLRFDFECSYPSCRKIKDATCFCSINRDGIKEINLATLDYVDLETRFSSAGVKSLFLDLIECSVEASAVKIIEFAKGGAIDELEREEIERIARSVGVANSSSLRSRLSPEEEELLNRLSTFFRNKH